jgi:DNA ligase-1
VLDNIGIDTDGELLIPGKTFQESLGRLRSHADVPEAVYYVFDTPDTMKAFEDRLDILKALQGTSKSIRVIKHELVRNEQELLSYYQKCRAAGLEGVVVKRMGHLYVGTRSRDWLKMKDVLSADAPIVSFKEGEGKYEGTLGAIVVKLRNGLLCDVGTGFTDKERDEIWENKINYLGRVVEVMYHERTNDGNLRHPRMSRFRPDK